MGINLTKMHNQELGNIYNKLNWVEHEPTINPFEAVVGIKTEHVVHLALFKELGESNLKLAVIDCINKAVELLPKNINDNSRYFLFEWDIVYSTLTVVTTDDSKESDSRHIVKCIMSTLDERMNNLASTSEEKWEVKTEEFSQLVRGWIHNYLTTCNGFMKYSLIAIFHNESRKNTKLL